MTLRFRRGNPAPDYVLKDGEPGWDSQNKIFKIGDGVTPWSDLRETSGVDEDSVSAAVLEYFEQNPVVGATTEYVQGAISDHKEEAEPHKAYDLDIPSLSLIFQNGLV